MTELIGLAPHFSDGTELHHGSGVRNDPVERHANSCRCSAVLGQDNVLVLRVYAHVHGSSIVPCEYIVTHSAYPISCRPCLFEDVTFPRLPWKL